jgi:cyclase
VEAIRNGADAVAAAYMYHFTEYTPRHVKRQMHKFDIPARSSE